MTAEEPKMAFQENLLVRALARWEWEGGRVEPDGGKNAALGQEEEHILQCLGAAVVMRWNSLPTEVKRELFTSAVLVGEPLPTAELKEHIARFLHCHKDFRRG